jgi:hypothetical protein
LSENKISKIIFPAGKIHVHRWPMTSPVWSQSVAEKVENDLNKNTKEVTVVIDNLQIQIERYVFDKIKKVGLTIPLFKKEATLVFEGHFEDYYAHVHITAKSPNYLEIFNNLVLWKNQCFPDSV